MLAAPVCAPQSSPTLHGAADEVVCLHQRADFVAVGTRYEDFPRLTDADVVRLLEPTHGQSSLPVPVSPTALVCSVRRRARWAATFARLPHSSGMQ